MVVVVDDVDRDSDVDKHVQENRASTRRESLFRVVRVPPPPPHIHVFLSRVAAPIASRSAALPRVCRRDRKLLVGNTRGRVVIELWPPGCVSATIRYYL